MKKYKLLALYITCNTLFSSTVFEEINECRPQCQVIMQCQEDYDCLDVIKNYLYIRQKFGITKIDMRVFESKVEQNKLRDVTHQMYFYMVKGDGYRCSQFENTIKSIQNRIIDLQNNGYQISDDDVFAACEKFVTVKNYIKMHQKEVQKELYHFK